MTNPDEAPVPDGSPLESRSTVRRAPWFVLAAGSSLLPSLWLAMSIDDGNPTWWKPFPLIPLFFTFALDSKIAAFLFGSFIVVPSFALFNWPLVKGNARIPKRYAIFVFLYILNGFYLLALFSEGVKHLGSAHTVTVCSITFFLFVGMVILGVLCVRRPSFPLALACQWLAWFWFVHYSFPVLRPLFVLV